MLGTMESASAGPEAVVEFRLLSGKLVEGDFSQAASVQEARRLLGTALCLPPQRLRLTAGDSCLRDAETLLGVSRLGLVQVCIMTDPQEVKFEAKVAKWAGAACFDELLQQAEESGRLDLASRRLASLPQRAGSLKVSELSLADNRLAAVPPQLGQMAKLRRLSLERNRLQSIPVDLMPSSLEKLQIGDNQLACLSDSFFARLNKLEELSAESNQLSSLPTRGGHNGLGSLKVLRLDRNRLTELPCELLGFMSGLMRLELRGNRLTGLPESIGQLARLELLEVSGNPLTSLPRTLSQLAGLQTLLLNGVWLEALPRDFGAGGLSRCLKRLELSRGQLGELPDSIGELEELESLDVNGNRIACLPESFSRLRKLQRCNLSANRLTMLPEAFGELASLQDLILNENSLRSLPETFGQLSALRGVELKGNKLNALPASTSQLTALQHMNLRGNPIPISELSERLRDLVVGVAGRASPR